MNSGMRVQKKSAAIEEDEESNIDALGSNDRLIYS